MDNNKKYNFTKETAINCPEYRDCNVNGCVFSNTFELYAKEGMAGIWCAKCFNPFEKK